MLLIVGSLTESTLGIFCLSSVGGDTLQDAGDVMDSLDKGDGGSSGAVSAFCKTAFSVEVNKEQ